MASFRIETVSDPKTSMVFAEAYAEPGDTLIARSEPIFHSHDEAQAEVKGVIQRAWPDRAPDAVDLSIGV